jgi:hypothetical protein
MTRSRKPPDPALRPTLEDFAFYLADEHDEARKIIDEAVESFLDYEPRKMHLIESLDRPNSIVLPFKYEDIVADPAKTLATILHQVSLTFEPGQLDWTNTTFHPLGGNNGALMKAGVPLGLKRVKRAYYEQAKEAVFLDDKYQTLFNADLKRYIREHDGYKRLLDDLEYTDIL